MALETTITGNIVEYLESLPNCTVEKILGCSAQKDRPDLGGCWNGRSFRIEVKSPDYGNMPTQGQILNLKRWSRAGALCFVAWSLDDVKAMCWNLNGDLDLNTVLFHGWYITPNGKIIKYGHKGGSERVNTKAGNKVRKSKT